MRVWTCAALSVLAISLLGQAADITTIEQIIAKVNGDIITRGELDRLRKQTEAELRQRGANAQQIAQAMKEREGDTLRDRIDQLLLIQRGKDLSINVDTEVSKYLANIQSENKIADPEKFQAWVKEQTGMTFEDFRSEIRNSYLSQRVIGQEVASKVNIPRTEIEAYYNEHKNEFLRKERLFLREILISNEGKDPAAMEKKAKDVAARAKKGEKFAELVRDNSDAVTAKGGGFLEPFEKDVLSPELVAATWDKPKGFVTEPMKVPAGWLILRVEDHHKEGQAALEEVEGEIRERIYGPRMQPKVREFLTQLREESFLEIRQGFVDTGAAPGKDTSWSDPAMLKPETVTKEEVLNQTRKRRLLMLFPIPGTNVNDNRKSSSK
jgi:peptidyl-prolyl cis-trans isomerase SurA